MAIAIDLMFWVWWDKYGFVNNLLWQITKFLKSKFCFLNFILYLCTSLETKTDTKTDRYRHYEGQN